MARHEATNRKTATTLTETGQGDVGTRRGQPSTSLGPPQLSEGQRVYVAHPLKGWATGMVMNLLDHDKVKVKLDSGQIMDRSIGDVLLKSEGDGLESCCNLTNLCPVNEATVLHCLCKRFEADIFYTRAGSSMIAVNPCKDVSRLYGYKTIQQYHNCNGHSNLGNQQPPVPHIYELAETAYVAMRRKIGCSDQSIVISGESGAGKTVSTKHLLRYLTVISSTFEKDENLDVSFPGSAIENRVLVSNPILEAFGNAATPRNENSSRFGKFIQLQFDRAGTVIGGIVQTYLLEKTRIVHQKYQTDERHFHIFNQLLTLGQVPSVPAWLELVKKAVCESGMPAIHPSSLRTESLMETVQALTDVGISCITQVHIFKTLLAILHLRQIDFVSSSHGDGSDISAGDRVSIRARDLCCRLLELSPMGLHQAFIRRSIVSGGNSRRSVFSKACLVSEAKARRDCFVMLLYTKLFDWLVAFINRQIQADTFDHCINLLDIYGFEAFDINSLEQLCINYANERLQQFYVSHFLRDLQSEYEAEGIAWTHVTYTDNKACVSAIDSTVGVFGILNEEIYLNRKSDDLVLRDRIVHSAKGSGVVFRARQQKHADSHNHFLVCHYAGDVVYDVTHTVSKNQDNIPLEFVQLLSQSTNPLVLDLFTSDSLTNNSERTPTSVKSKKRKTVLTKFKLSLDGLMDHLNKSACHYIRCIKPNQLCSPGQLDSNFVLQQLRACGTLETVEICHKGYPARMLYVDFVQRYGLLQSQKNKIKNSSSADAPPAKPEIRVATPSGDINAVVSTRPDFLGRSDGIKRKMRKRWGQTVHNEHHGQCADVLLQTLPAEQLGQLEQQFGRTKLFLSQAQLELLEQVRMAAITLRVAKVQSMWKCHVQRIHYRKLLCAIRSIQAHWRGFAQRKQLERCHSAAACIQRKWKTHKLKLSLRKLSHHLQVLRRVVHKWVHRHRQRQQNLNYSCVTCHYPALERQDKILDDSSRQVLDSTRRDNDKTNPEQMSFSMTPVDEFCSQESLSASMEKTDTNEEREDGADLDSVYSDDSGVMIRENDRPSTSATCEGDMGVSPAKKLRLALREYLHYGNRIATCRKLTEPGLRFHTRKSVLQYGHVTHHRHLIKGLPDALGANDDETKDSHSHKENNH